MEDKPAGPDNSRPWEVAGTRPIPQPESDLLEKVQLIARCESQAPTARGYPRSRCERPKAHDGEHRKSFFAHVETWKD